MAKVYISGPMRKHKGCNFAAFDRAAALGRSLGWTVISPAEMDRAHGITGQESADCNHDFGTEASRQFARRDSKVLLEDLKAEDGDAIALLPGWVDSTGGKAELALAKWVGLMVVDATTFLPLNASIEGVERRPAMPAQFAQCGTGHCGGFEEEEAIKVIADQLANQKEI